MAYAALHPERVSHLVLLGGYTHGLLQRSPTAEGLAYFEAVATLMRHGWGQAGSAVQRYVVARMQRFEACTGHRGREVAPELCLLYTSPSPRD